MSSAAEPGPHLEPLRDPLRRVLELGRREAPIGIAIGICGALALHGAAVGRGMLSLFQLSMFAERVELVVKERQRAAYDIDLSEQARPPEPDPPPEPEKKETVKIAAPAQNQKADEPPPEAAQAGKVLTQEPSPDDPLDLTDKGFVTGNGDRYAGGTTASSGTSQTAVNDVRAKGGGAPGGQGKKPGGSGGPSGAGPKDQSRAAKPTSLSWNCGFPPEADFEQIDYATVTISVTVGTDGRAKSVTVLSDPGHGFGRLAKSCAMRMQYTPGVDKDGQPVVKTTAPFPVRFTR